MIHVQLPDRKEISLCEAVTAFIYGTAYDVRHVADIRGQEVTVFFYDGKQLEDVRGDATTNIAKLDDLSSRISTGLKM